MYKLYRYYYHKLLLQPTHYYMDEHSFSSSVELRDYVYSTYREGYTIEEKRNGYGLEDFIIYNDTVEIHCVTGRDD